MKNDDLVTKKHLDKRLGSFKTELKTELGQQIEDRLNSQTEILLEAINGKLSDHQKQINANTKRIDSVVSVVDGVVKKQDDLSAEFTVMNAEMDQVKDAVDKKLGVKIKAT